MGVTRRACRPCACLVAAVLFLVACCHAPCGVAGPGPDDGLSAERGPPTVAAGEEHFAFDLYAALRERPGNLCFSPLSVHAALAMACAGSRGSTLEQMRVALRLRADGHGQYARLLADMRAVGASPDATLYMANALWMQTGYGVRPAFRTLLEKGYRAQLHEVDFAADPRAAVRAIGKWSSEQIVPQGQRLADQRSAGDMPYNEGVRDITARPLPHGGKAAGDAPREIPAVVDPTTVQPQTRLVLACTLSLHAEWSFRFDEADTRPDVFHVGPGVEVSAAMMRQTKPFVYADAGCVDVLSVPYRAAWTEPSFDMVVLLPKARDGLAAIERQLSSQRLACWLSAGRPRWVEVSLPRFTVSGRFDLREILTALGMADAFARHAADFRGITGVDEPLWIDEVAHRASIDVNERGTTALALTRVGFFGAGRDEEPVAFVADHPFLFLIRDTASGAILFMGRVADPTAKS